jgi:hypothetical protein
LTTFNQFSCVLITNATYTIVGGTATGTVTIQEQTSAGTWQPLTSPAALTLGAGNLNGPIAGAFHGLRLTVSSLAVANIPYMELRGTVAS